MVKKAGSEGLYGPGMLYLANTALVKRKEAENQKMGQSPAKDMTCRLGKPASHDVAVDGSSDRELLEVQAASPPALLSGAQADSQSTFSISGLKPKPSEVSWRLSMFCE